MAIDKHQITGRLKQAKGSVKRAAGKATGKTKLRATGAIEAQLGKAEAAYGGARATAKSAARTVAKRVRTSSKQISKLARKVRAKLPRSR